MLHCLKTRHCVATSYDVIKLQSNALREKALLFNLIAIYYSLDTESLMLEYQGITYRGNSNAQAKRRRTFLLCYNLALT